LLQDKVDLYQKEFINIGAINEIKKIVKEQHAENILLVTGKQSYISSGAKEKLDQILVDTHTEQFNQFCVNPKIEDVSIGIALLKNTKFDLIVAIGGGSVIDMAKLINILAAQEDENLLKYIDDSTLITNKGLPCVAIPTTSGTGSEVTHFAVVYIDNVKYSLAHQYMLPDYAIIDAELSYNLPQHITASSGMDALSQAVESYWAIKSTNESKKYAAEAIGLILPILKGAVDGNKKSRAIMSKAAHLAGKAINITTTTAPHAISYAITTYFGLQHGHAVALTLGHFFVINHDLQNADIVDVRGEEYLKCVMDELFEMFGVGSSLECKNRWYNIMSTIGLESSMQQIGILTENDVEKIINKVNIQRLNNNPVKLEKEKLRRIFLCEGLGGV